MLDTFAHHLDITDVERRLRHQMIRLDMRRRPGMPTDCEEAELARIADTLTHLDHHRKIFAFSLQEYRRAPTFGLR